MSGIAGIYNLDGRPVEKTDLERMTASLARHGPDGSGIWSNGPAGLGHAMLWTTPESLHERLPFTDKAGNLSITADARIDNRDELTSTLSLNSRPPEEIGDSELILLSYEKWGENCPAKLLGDFAFTIWDKRNQTMFCARDYFGVKPFCYYHRAGGAFVFGSEPRVILANRAVAKRINEPRIADYLVDELEGIDNTSTFYQDILRLPPGHSLTVRSDRLLSRPYWSLDPEKEIRCGSDEEYGEAFRDIFTEAVRCRLRSAFPSASMLSGGMDSSAIVGVARRLLMENGNSRLRTFSAVSADESGCAETYFINSVLHQNEVIAHTVRPDQLNLFIEDLGYIPRNADNLFDNFMTVPQLMYIAAHKQGIKVILDGVDGDLVSSHGTGYLTYLLRPGRWKTAVDEAIGYAKFWHHYHPSPWRLLLRNVGAAFVPATLRRLRGKLRRLSLKEAIGDTVINADFAQRISLTERLETLRKHEYPIQLSTLREVHAKALTAPSITAALERYEGVASAYSVEPRHPFFDKRLVEFCLALPWEQKIHRGCSKIILRRAMEGMLPEDVRWRAGKEHLGREFSMSTFALEKGLFNQLMGNQLEGISDYVNAAAVRDTYQRSVSQQATAEDMFKLWQAVTLSLWLRRN